MNYSQNSELQQRSYGSYDQQQPMKTFAGQPHWATDKQVDQLQMRVDDLEEQMDKQHPVDKAACDRCPKYRAACDRLEDPNKRDHCVQMFDQCQKVCGHLQ